LQYFSFIQLSEVDGTDKVPATPFRRNLASSP